MTFEHSVSAPSAHPINKGRLQGDGITTAVLPLTPTLKSAHR